MKHVASNFFYQSIYQITKILIPIITIPLVSRALGPSGIGIYNYTNSIVQYFMLCAGLGISLYGSREIAIVSDNKEKLSEKFWELFTFKFILSLAMLTLYFIVVSFFKERFYFYIQSFALITVMFDVSWFFMGVQDFKKSGLSSFFAQIMVFFLIVLLVKDSADVGKYIFIQSFGLLFSQVLMLFFLKNKITKCHISIKKSFKHFRESLNYFIPQVSITLYNNLNKTLIGVFISQVSVGYYSNALTLNIVFITLLSTLDTVMLPHMSSLYAKNNISEIIKTLRKTVHVQLFFSIAIFFGVLTIYDKLVPWFFGEKFIYITSIIPLISILIIIIPLGTSFSRQYLLPMGNTKDYNISVMIGAGINILLNIILLPTIGFYGVIFANIIAEFFVTFSRIVPIIIKKDFSFYLKRIFLWILSGIIMCVTVRFLSRSLGASLLTNIFQGILGFCVYMLCTWLFRVNILKELFLKRKV